MKTWVDPKTGLKWQITSPEKPMNWQEAMTYAESLRDDWRLPAIKELETLLDRSKFDPAVRKEVLFRDSLFYWSSTTYAGKTSNAWGVDFYNGGVDDYGKANNYYVRCVRGEAK